jgi:hypothetical protein
VSNQSRLLIRWAGAGLEALLGALGLDVEDNAVALRSARIVIDQVEPAAGVPRLTVELLSSGPPPKGIASLDVAAVGWATVELDRAAASLGDRPQLGVEFEPAARDALLGATARRSQEGNPEILLLEPDTEGRLAGALARYGEGPIALYLRVLDPATTAARVIARQGTGPLGPEWLVPGGHPAGPFLLLVGDPAPTRIDRVPSEP